MASGMYHSHRQPVHYSANNQRGEWVKEEDNIIRFSAKALNITWGNDQRFWHWVELPQNEARTIGFEAAAELLQVNWLEVKGALDLAQHSNLQTSKTYEIMYNIKFKADAFGWNSSDPVSFELATTNGHKMTVNKSFEFDSKKRNVWQEFYGGEFKFNKDSRGKLEFSMRETKTDWWKGGMVLGSVTIRPKQCA